MDGGRPLPARMTHLTPARQPWPKRLGAYLRGPARQDGVQGAVRDAFVWNTLNVLSSQSISFLVFLWLSRVLEPSVFGVFALALVAADLFTQQLKSAAMDAIMQRGDYSAAALSNAFFVLAAVCGLAPAAAWAASDWAAAAFGAPALRGVLPALALGALFVPWMAVCEAQLVGRFGYRVMALRNMGGVLAGAAAAVCVGLSPAYEWALVAQRLTQSAFATAFLLMATRWRPQLRFVWGEARGFTLATAQMWLAQISAISAGIVGAGILGYRLGAAALGLVRVAGRFVEMLHGPLTAPVSQLLIPALAKLRDQPQQTSRLVLELVGLSAAVSVPAFAGLAVVAQDLTAGLLDPDYAAAGGALTLIALQNCLTPLGYFRDGVLSGLGRNALRLAFSIGDFSMLGLLLWIGAGYGLQIALYFALGHAVLLTLAAVLTLSALLRISPWRYLGAAAPAYGAAAMMALAVLGFQAATPDWPALARLFAGAGLGAAVYAMVVLLAFRPWAMRALDMLRGRGRFV